jgi:DNA topoisomerase-6 subunit B
MAGKKAPQAVNAESLSRLQRDISVSEFFLKNRHLLGFDNPRKALLTAVKEAVDNSLDACDEAGILPEISVEIVQTADKRFRISVQDNGPGIVRAMIPKIFAKLLFGSKFHRLRMSRGQQGIGISAAGMYSQLTTGTATTIRSKTGRNKPAHLLEVQIDTRANKPVVLRDQETDWQPVFHPAPEGDGPAPEPVTSEHGTCVSMEMEAAYVRGKQSVDEYLAQCAIVNPHLQLHYRLILLPAEAKDKGASAPNDAATAAPQTDAPSAALESGAGWTTYRRATTTLPVQPAEIMPHPHGVELGMLMKMLKDTTARTLRSALAQDFSRVSPRTALEICQRAGLDPAAKPAAIAHRESEALYKAIADTKLMRPPTDCLSPIGEEAIVAGLRKEVQADFYTAVTREPTVYRGNPFQIEVGIACARPDAGQDLAAEEPVRVLRFANKVPLLYMAGACAITKAMTSVNWKAYGLAQPRGSLPLGPVVVLVHIASVWVPFTSESKEAVAHYPEIIRELTFGLQEAGRRLAVFMSRRRRQAELERKHNYISLYLPHLALGLKTILDLNDKEEAKILANLKKMLERSHLET